MQFSFTDAWVLHAIHANEKPGSGAVLLDIIGYADYIDHAVMEYHELSGSLAKLLPLGLVVQTEHNLATTERYRTWWDITFAGKKRIDIQKALHKVKDYLNQTFATATLPETPVELNIQPQDFSRVLDIYLKRT